MHGSGLLHEGSRDNAPSAASGVCIPFCRDAWLATKSSVGPWCRMHVMADLAPSSCRSARLHSDALTWLRSAHHHAGTSCKNMRLAIGRPDQLDTMLCRQISQESCDPCIACVVLLCTPARPLGPDRMCRPITTCIVRAAIRCFTDHANAILELLSLRCLQEVHIVD